MVTKTVKFKKLSEKAELPTYAHDGDIGLDIKAVSLIYDKINDVYIYGTGLACETEGHMGILGMMKSGIYKHGDCYLTNAVGLIDSDQYRGEIKYIYRSRTPIWVRAMHATLRDWSCRSVWYRLTHSFSKMYGQYMNDVVERTLEFAPYNVGDVCGQLVPVSFDKINVVEAKELSKTERGTGGFGSTEKARIKKKLKEKDKKLSKVVKDM